MVLTLLRRIPLRLALVPAVCLSGAGCAYFNTFYNAQTYYREGVKLKEQQQTVQAKAKFEKSIEKSALVISRWPKSRWVDDATFLIGMGYYEMGQYQKAVRNLERLVLAFPNSGFVPRAELYRGLSLLRDQEYGVARVVLQQVQEEYPGLADVAAFHLADAAFEREEYSRAVESLAAFVERFPRSGHLRSAIGHLAQACFKLERWREAESWYLRLVRVSNDAKERVLARLRIAACQLELEEHQQAMEQIEDVLGRYPDLDDEANLLQGKALAAMGRAREAADAWVKVRGNSDDGAEAFFRIGKFHEEQRDFARARAFYDTARSRRINSDFGVLAVKRLSLLDAFARKDSSKREPAEAMFLLAEVHNLNLGDYDEAMKLYHAVYDSFPESDWAPKALFAEVWIFKNAKQDSEPVPGLLRKIIDEYPETEYADESRRWLGLPVPKRKPKAQVPTPESVAVRPDTFPMMSELDSGPVSTDSAALDTAGRPTELAHEPPEMYPERRRPGRERVRYEIDEATGVRQPAGVPEVDEVGPAGAAERESVVSRDTGTPGELAVSERPSDTAEAAEEPRVPAGDEAVTIGEKQEKLEFELVHFDTDSWNIRPKDAEVLGRNVSLLSSRAGAKVVVVGHCDPRGTEEYNSRLGFKRAQAVRDFLVEAGVPDGRLSVRSEGELRPISTNPDEYWLDRRVVLELGE